MSANEKFLDILVPRRKEASVFQYMTRPWNPQKTFNLDQHYSPTKIKAAAANSVYIDAILEAVSFDSVINFKCLIFSHSLRTRTTDVKCSNFLQN